MSNPISSVGAVRPAGTPDVSSREPTRGRFADALVDAAKSIQEGHQLIQRTIRQARSGRTFSNEELIALQAGVYRYTQELEIASKLVDKATSAVRTTLQSQQ